jgi:hypothetical protein
MERNLKDEVVFMYDNKPMCGTVCGKTTFIGVKWDETNGHPHASEEGNTKYHIRVAGMIIDLYEDHVFSTVEDLQAALFSIIKK